MTHLTFAHLASVHGPIIWEPRSGRSFVQEEREMQDRKIYVALLADDRCRGGYVDTVYGYVALGVAAGGE